jgi:hypothetical protein
MAICGRGEAIRGAGVQSDGTSRSCRPEATKDISVCTRGPYQTAPFDTGLG